MSNGNSEKKAQVVEMAQPAPQPAPQFDQTQLLAQLLTQQQALAAQLMAQQAPQPAAQKPAEKPGFFVQAKAVEQEYRIFEKVGMVTLAGATLYLVYRGGNWVYERVTGESTGWPRVGVIRDAPGTPTAGTVLPIRATGTK